MRGGYWSKEDIDILKEHYPFEPNEKIMKRISPRSLSSIYTKAGELGLKKTKEVIKRINDENRLSLWNVWSSKEVIILQRFYSSMPNSKLLKLLPQKTRKQINAKAFRLGIKKSKASRKEEARISAEKRMKYHPHTVWQKGHKNLLTPEGISLIRSKRLNQVFPKRDSSIEIALQKALREIGVNFETHFPFPSARTQIDIAIPNKKVAVYCDGDYWHNLPEYIERDKRANDILREEGWRVIRFWEHKINSSVLECVNEIKEVIEN